MNLNKREFIFGTGLLGAAGCALTQPTADQNTAGARTSSVFNVRDFGAKGDGQTPDSEAIQKALDAAGAVSGTTYFPAGTYLCHDLHVHAHTTVLAEPQWSYRGDAGAMLVLDSSEADCLLNITGAFGAHLHGLFLRGKKEAKKAIHGVFLNNAEKYSPQEDSIVIDDCKVERFSGHGVHLLRIWSSLSGTASFKGNAGCGRAKHLLGRLRADTSFSGTGSTASAVKVSDRPSCLPNRVEWNAATGSRLQRRRGNGTGNCFDRTWARALRTQMRTTTVG